MGKIKPAIISGTYAGHVTTNTDDNVQSEIVVATTDDMLKTTPVSSDSGIIDSDGEQLQIDFDIDDTDDPKTDQDCKDITNNAGSVAAAVNAIKHRKPVGSTSGRLSVDNGIKRIRLFSGSNNKERCSQRRLKVYRAENHRSLVVRSDHCYATGLALIRP